MVEELSRRPPPGESRNLNVRDESAREKSHSVIPLDQFLMWLVTIISAKFADYSKVVIFLSTVRVATYGIEAALGSLVKPSEVKALHSLATSRSRDRPHPVPRQLGTVK